MNNRTAFFSLGIILLSLAVFVINPPRVQAAGINVDSALDDALAVLDGDGACSLREAVDNANTDLATYADCTAGSGDDIITFNANYTIIISNNAGETNRLDL